MQHHTDMQKPRNAFIYKDLRDSFFQMEHSGFEPLTSTMRM